MRPIIFDLDGTLADTWQDVAAAANATFSALGLGRPLDPATDAEVALIGGGRQMLRHGHARLGQSVTNDEIEAQYAMLVGNYRRALCVHSRLFPGCAEALVRLKGRGHGLAVCTNKPTELAEPLLAELGIREYFNAVIGAGSLPHRKPHAAPVLAAVEACGPADGGAVLVGDTLTDRRAAAAAGIASVLVTFGPLGQGVADYGPEALLHHFDEIEDCIAGLQPDRRRVAGHG